ncbi:MAG: Crp/Fnr family transcriptional regulator [Flavobacteriales bacterium]|nr:Crp/Fnr family transcriptional regulator [Flavobacteriales bacterium]|tara:strand:+ start:313 stop:945 length:633 start_codon:yes stop_codon:yes gene_type:complete
MTKEQLKNFSLGFEPELMEEIEREGKFKTFKAGETIVQAGHVIRSIPILLNGLIRVYRIDDNGDELLMYYLGEGETCAMTLNCCLGQKRSEIEAEAEMDSQILFIPVEKMEEWSSKYDSWRNYVLESYHQRMMELINTIDKIAFKKLDERLLEYLEHEASLNENGEIRKTHKEIARALNSSRVVISRLLKALEKEGMLKLERNRIYYQTV